MTYEYLLVNIEKNIATLTINRPQVMNALNRQLLDEFAFALNSLQLNDAVRVIIITGAGDKAFIAGGDIKEMAAMGPYEAHQFALKGQQILFAMEEMSKPVIAAINGYALGGGLELALACDFIYASSNAKLGFPEVNLGVMPGFGGTQNLARLVGRNKAKEMIFTGRTITAEKACSWGILNEAYAPADLLPKVKETAALMATVGPLGVSCAKDAIGNGLDMTKEDGLRYEASLFGILFSTADQREGMAAFVEKRKARFLAR